MACNAISANRCNGGWPQQPYEQAAPAAANLVQQGGGGADAARGAGGGNGDIGALTEHVNGILADGRDHGFKNGIDSYIPRIQEAMGNLKKAGIVTADEPYQAMQQAEKWLMSNAGKDGVFSFGGGPANEDDAAALEAKSGISRGDINAIKFMFDDKHDAQLTQEDQYLTVDPNNAVFQDLAGVLSRAGLFEHR